MGPADGGRGPRAVCRGHGVLDEPAGLLGPPVPPQGVGELGQGFCVLAAVRIDTGQLHGSPFVLGDVRRSRQGHMRLPLPAASACSPTAGHARRRRGQVPRGAADSPPGPASPAGRPSPARSRSRAWPTVSVASAATSHRSAARTSRSAASRGAASFSARSAPWRRAVNAAEGRRPVRGGSEVAEPAQLVDHPRSRPTPGERPRPRAPAPPRRAGRSRPGRLPAAGAGTRHPHRRARRHRRRRPRGPPRRSGCRASRQWRPASAGRWGDRRRRGSGRSPAPGLTTLARRRAAPG